MIPPEIAELIRRFGERKLKQETDECIHFLFQEGYCVFPAVQNFLRTCDGLIIQKPVNHTDWFDFKSSQASSGIHPERVKMLSSQIGRYLCPIGEADCGNTTLLMDQNGQVYGDGGNEICLIGETWEQAIRVLYLGGSRKKFEMKCKKCNEPGIRKGDWDVESYQLPYEDENGRLHNHSLRVKVTYWYCRNEHKWETKLTDRCWCGETGVINV